MKNIICGLIISASLSSPAFAQSQETGAKALAELRGSLAGDAAEVPAAGAPERVKPPHQPLPGGYQPGAAITEFRSGEFRFSMDARKSMEKAVAGLKARGLAVIEAEAAFGAYTITFVAPRPVRVLAFESREYDFGVDAERALDKIADALEATGAVVLERNMKTMRSFRLQYIETSREAALAGGRRVLEFQSGEFALPSDASKSLKEAERSLAAAGFTLVESEKSVDRYGLTVVAARPAALREFVSREYQSPVEARRALRDTVEALEQMGAAVVEQRLPREIGAKFSIKYLETRGEHSFPHF